MTDDLNRTCPHCGGKNTSYFIGIEETVWFTTKYEIADGCGLFDAKAELAIVLRDNDTGSDALTP